MCFSAMAFCNFYTQEMLTLSLRKLIGKKKKKRKKEVICNAGLVGPVSTRSCCSLYGVPSKTTPCTFPL